MKKILLIASLSLLAVGSISLNAKNKKPQYVPNRFGDNWSIFAAGGVNATFDGWFRGDFDYGFRPGVNAGFAKWFNPFFGSRLSYTGYEYKFKTNVFKNNAVAIDLMWNWSNQFGKFKPGRVYEAVPYLRAAVNFGDPGTKFSGGAGYLSYFNLSEHWSITIDLNASIVNGKQIMEPNGGFGLIGGAYLGLVWRIGKSSWTPGSEVVPAADYAIAKSALETANRNIEALTSENKVLKENEKNLNAEIVRLKGLLAQAEADGTFDQTMAEVFEDYVPLCHFAIGKTKLSETELENLACYASLIAKSKSLKFAIVGSADPGTGSAKMNKKLRTDRAIYVYNLLSQLGVSVDKINIVSDPKCDSRSKNAELCRACLIKVIK